MISSIFIFAPAKLGGAEKVVLSALRSLKEKAKVSIVVIEEERVPENAQKFCFEMDVIDVPYKIVRTRSALDLKLPLKLSRAIQSLAIELKMSNFILHSHGYKALLYTLPISHFFQLVHTHHGNTSHTLKVRLYESVALLAMNFCDKVMAVSHQMQSYLESKVIAKEKVVLLENMISLSSEEIRDLGHTSKAINSTAPLKLLYAGRLSREKGLGELIWAIKNLETSEYQFELEILGAGEFEDELKRIIKEENIKNIHFHGLRSDVSTYLANTQFMVLPSYSEGLPMIVLEAAALGVPILATRVGGIPEIVENNKSGILFGPKSVTALERALKQAWIERQKLSMGAIKLKEKIVAQYGAESWARKCLRIYQDLL